MDLLDGYLKSQGRHFRIKQDLDLHAHSGLGVSLAGMNFVRNINDHYTINAILVLAF